MDCFGDIYSWARIFFGFWEMREIPLHLSRSSVLNTGDYSFHLPGKELKKMVLEETGSVSVSLQQTA